MIHFSRNMFIYIYIANSGRFNIFTLFMTLFMTHLFIKTESNFNFKNSLNFFEDYKI